MAAVDLSRFSRRRTIQEEKTVTPLRSLACAALLVPARALVCRLTAAAERGRLMWYSSSAAVLGEQQRRRSGRRTSNNLGVGYCGSEEQQQKAKRVINNYRNNKNKTSSPDALGSSSDLSCHARIRPLFRSSAGHLTKPSRTHMRRLRISPPQTSRPITAGRAKPA